MAYQNYYLVYNYDPDSGASFVSDSYGKPRKYEDLDMAQECASNQTNGYVVPLGWDCIDWLLRQQDLGEILIAEGEMSEDIMTKAEELAKEALEILQQC